MVGWCEWLAGCRLGVKVWDVLWAPRGKEKLGAGG